MTSPSSQGMPNMATPLVNEDGTMNPVWYRFFLSLFTRSGLGTPGITVNGTTANSPIQIAPAFWVNYLPPNSTLVVADQFDGSLIGTIVIVP